MRRQSSKPYREPLSLMTYSHDGYGLGHLRRNSNIAARFVQEVPGSTALMLTGCPAGNVFPLPKGVDFIKIPSLVKVDTGVYTPLGLCISRQKAKGIRSSTIESAVSQFKPRVFLVDHVPAGVHGELLSTLRMLRELDDPPVIVLGLRDIIDDPNVVCELWRREKTYRTIREYYDEVLIYGSKEIFDAARHYRIDGELPGKVRYSGYVCSEGPLRSRDQVRDDLRLQSEKLVVVTAGGGHDAYPLMQSCLEAFQAIGKNIPFEAVLITGPLMELEQREHLRAQARGLGTRVLVLTCVEDPPSFINASDLVITMAGYNSLCEILSLTKKALVVPRLGPRAEQRMRADLFQERGLIDVLDPREASPRNLADRIIRDLGRSDLPLTNGMIDMSGARNAARRLSALAQEKRALQPLVLPRSHAAGPVPPDHALAGESTAKPNQISPGKWKLA